MPWLEHSAAILEPDQFFYDAVLSIKSGDKCYGKFAGRLDFFDYAFENGDWHRYE
jgi:hypothetical protein